MLDISDLKLWLHRSLTQRDKLLIILSSFDNPCQVTEIKQRGKDAGFRIPKKWNCSTTLNRSKGLAIRTSVGWEITLAGQIHLRDLGIEALGQVPKKMATDLRGELCTIQNSETKSFVEEAIACYEHGLYRSAVVMSWIGAVSVLHHFIFSKHLSEFNAEARRVDARWKDAKTVNDMSRMKESDLLDRIAAISIIGKDVKKELNGCLDRRNSCGHPNSLRIRDNTVAHHIEVLMLNVFKIFR